MTGGIYGGRRLRCPRGGLRPTADRVREAMFARLDPADAVVLDLYAGSGALGIEALSRGARRAVFVERSAAALVALRANLDALGVRERSRVLAGDAVRAVRRLARAGERFDLVLLDPPYASGEAEKALRALAEGSLIAEGGAVVCERSRRHPVPLVAGLEAIDERRYGDTVIERLVASPDAAPVSKEG